MDNSNFNEHRDLIRKSKTLKDYIKLILNNFSVFITISLIIFIAALSYAIFSTDQYNSTVTLKIDKQKQSILETSGALPGISDLGSDRFIANETEIITNYDTRERYAKALIDSFDNTKDKSLFAILKSEKKANLNGHKPVKDIAEFLKNIISVGQKEGMDMIEISAESPSPYEAALIANTCAEQYKELNLEINRTQLRIIRKFLEKQSKEKLIELSNAEDTLKDFQERGGIIALDEQSKALISQLSQMDVQRDAAKIDLMTSSEILNQYKNELKKQDPHLVDYLENQTSQAYINVLQKQIAELQMNKDLAMGNKTSRIDVSEKVKDYDQRITELKQKLSNMINDIKAGAFASSPDQVKDLSQKLVEEEINNHALEIKLKELETIISKYELNFGRLPKKSIELAQYERKREGLKQLYVLVEQKYQEAMINELSQPGNVSIIGTGRIPDKPEEPNRGKIIFIGIVMGIGFGFMYIFNKGLFR